MPNRKKKTKVREIANQNTLHIADIDIYFFNFFSFIPFQNSNLTRLLKSSLARNSKTFIICTITPAALESTLSTFKVTKFINHIAGVLPSALSLAKF